MSRVVFVPKLPYDGVAESAITSNIVDVRDAVQWTFSARTISGTTSTHTVQYSNATHQKASDVPEASWSDGFAFGTASKASIYEGLAGVRFARFLREASGASFVIELNKLVG